MRILVTGGAGFIGSNFVHYWIRNYPKDEIVVLDKLTYAGNLESLKDLQSNPNFTFIKGDINDYRLVKEIMKDCTIVLHLAAETHVDRSLSGPEAAREFWDTNFVGTRNLVGAAGAAWLGDERRRKKFIHMSTDEVYGELPLEGGGKFRIDMPLQPRQPYSLTKAKGQLIAHLSKRDIPFPSGENYEAYKDNLLNIVVVNCTNVVGPYQFPEKFIPLAVTNVLEGKAIRVYGEGINMREWIWVEDLCGGFEKIIFKAEHKGGNIVKYELDEEYNDLSISPYLDEQALTRGEGTVYFFGSGQEISNMDLAKMILRKMGKPIVIRKEKEDPKAEATIHLVGDRPVHDLRYAIDFSETTRELGWKPTYNLDRSLDATIAWYIAHPEWWKPLKEGKKTVYEWETNPAQKERG